MWFLEFSVFGFSRLNQGQLLYSFNGSMAASWEGGNIQLGDQPQTVLN